ncbi:sodium channel protein Nach-like isoform X1 [Apis cerana]|uniref:sodium channel protein Nach-like isoform X1 n=1 Tax=Apis cerana TaxID=7461 RepID=UPI002B23BD2C|nr:sodium channel protein Nach-like isoform X1 [Apis cerana]XP_061932737.1 sodium channel protein Nach-like isoform X1 [Apis cerana]XP_061932738.1 sodium channel protein Nach-like isoform X1 [Apis cerana]XP_061932739.1 sodium channel protein Nach-like isoform X1 [Apis cerana]
MKRMRKQSCCNILQKIVRNCLKIIMKQISEFCQKTGLHGCKYICESQRSMIESVSDRVIWAIMVFSSLCIAIWMMKITYEYFMKNHILTVIETTHHGIWNYPFPAVTICDFNRVSLKLTKKLVDNLKLPPAVSKEFVVEEMRLLDELLYPGVHGLYIRNNLSRLQNIFEMNNLTIPIVMNSVTRSCESLLELCKWKTKKEDCNSIFQTSISRNGICCSFNYITHDLIMKQPSIKPRKITSCGYQSGLNILLNFDVEDYHASIVESIGIKIMLHDPYDYPDYDASSKLITVNKYSFLTVKPMEIYSTKDIKWVSNKQCTLHNEENTISDNLKRNFISSRYSFINCLTDCRATVIKKECGCIPYYYPQNNTRICNLRDVECLETFKFWYDTSWPGTDMSPKTLPFVELDIKNKPCNCKPDCNFYRYIMEYSAASLDKRVYYNDFTYTTYFSKGKSWKNQSIIHIFFGDLISIRYRRDTRYGWRHIFATYGGLLGIFAGFSFMFIFEIIYFFIIRILTDAYARKNME